MVSEGAKQPTKLEAFRQRVIHLEAAFHGRKAWAGAEWVFSVPDHSQALTTQHRQRVFGLFTPLPSRSFSGTGIKLAIHRKTTERDGRKHLGRISAGDRKHMPLLLLVGESEAWIHGQKS